MKKWHVTEQSASTQIAAAAVIAFMGGGIFWAIQTPIPWLLGPMTALLLASRFKRIHLAWSAKIRDTGLIIAGYSIGMSFTKESLFQITDQLSAMMLYTCLIVVFCALIALFISKISGIDYPTALTASIPGGLSQIIIFAEEMKDIDITTVAFFHVIRVLMVVFFVPFLVFSPLFTPDSSISSFAMLTDTVPQWGDLFPSIVAFGLVCYLAAKLGEKIKLPAPYFLGPVIAASSLTISGVHGPLLPPSLLDVSQFMIGGYIGLLLKPEQLKDKTKMISLSIISGLLLICASFAFSVLLSKQYDLSSLTSFLSLAPGGMDQMSIVAHEVNADVSTVTSYQLFRMMFIFFAVPAMLRLVLKIRWNKQEKTSRKTSK
ncbi:AbrB family transcriptional regulator [Domibacillus epiphyticus]|uniref:AbrB family transcriptional regulator n=1 Tax=Domibacillus epiphyticus TaxID=1714355 RepID=A0A1V2AC33_9BACI|nr:AbrB family transcriptional regulator [Domibacillus epiphyticus]OMP68364.1 AbrB family transcriptional regulator [Domibacillus epiphyticus]